MILITAFQPFGPKDRLLGTNASLEVLRRVDATRPGRYVTDVLAVGEEGLAAYRRLLSERAWTGLLPMGESGMIRSDHVVLEPLANIVERPGFVWPGRAAGTEPRPFRCRGGGAEAWWQGVDGSYWCNRIYLEALRWANGKGSVPVAFVHVPALIGESLPLYGRHVAALYKRFTGEVLAILDQMEQGPTGGAGSQ